MPITVTRVSAVVLTGPDGAFLTVRKQGTTRFMLPGGKPEPGESARQTAVRECQEELGVHLGPDDLRDMGEFRAAAANEQNTEVLAAVFSHPAPQAWRPTAEIAEVRWLHPSGPLPGDLAPLLTDCVIPRVTGSR